MAEDFTSCDEERARIRSAAARCVRQSGCQSVTLEMIAQEAEVSLATVHRHYSQPEIAFADLAISHLESVESDIARSGTDPDPATILAGQLEQARSWSENGDAFLFFNFLGEAERNPSIRRILGQGRNYARKALERAISEGKLRGTIDASVDEGSVATLISALVHASLIMRLFDSDAEIRKANFLLTRMLRDLTARANTNLERHEIT